MLSPISHCVCVCTCTFPINNCLLFLTTFSLLYVFSVLLLFHFHSDIIIIAHRHAMPVGSAVVHVTFTQPPHMYIILTLTNNVDGITRYHTIISNLQTVHTRDCYNKNCATFAEYTAHILLDMCMRIDALVLQQKTNTNKKWWTIDVIYLNLCCNTKNMTLAASAYLFDPFLTLFKSWARCVQAWTLDTKKKREIPHVAKFDCPAKIERK